MTREEAIDILRKTSWFAPSLVPVDEAIDMAIGALSNNIIESPKEAIKRQNDVIEVVRCKDCKRRWTDGCMMCGTEWITVDDGDGYQEDYYDVRDYTVDDGYCSYGERKGGEDE